VSARDAVLSKIRRALAVDGGDIGRRAMVIARLEGAPKGVIPARGRLPQAERIVLFRKMAEKVSATVAEVSGSDAIPEAVADYLRSHNLPAQIRTGDDPLLAGLPWNKTPIDIARGASDGLDAVSVGHALAGVAETGTLVLASGPDNPTTLNFLPETQIVVLAAGDIVGDYETVWDRLRARFGKGALPRTVNLITGPSRSADIEQTLLLGAHGPRRLHIIVIGA
jgi:L-lactate dehydrogenase complex protein LldG